MNRGARSSVCSLYRYHALYYHGTVSYIRIYLTGSSLPVYRYRTASYLYTGIYVIVYTGRSLPCRNYEANTARAGRGRERAAARAKAEFTIDQGAHFSAGHRRPWRH